MASILTRATHTNYIYIYIGEVYRVTNLGMLAVTSGS